MIIVIQCAASKRPGAGHLRTVNGRLVDFVADPAAAPANPARVYARPDDPSDEGITWRQVLLRYNESRDNPLGLNPAHRLYENAVYSKLVDRFGIDRVYILSAGWGLIPADFLTPSYDITFSASADAYKRRRKGDQYKDFSLPAAVADGEIVFFGGKDYLPLFTTLTSSFTGRRTVFYNSASRPDATGCVLRRYETTTRTNWHYECANAVLDGTVRTG